jgi:hypothetical protein
MRNDDDAIRERPQHHISTLEREELEKEIKFVKKVKNLSKPAEQECEGLCNWHQEIGTMQC